MQLVLSAAKMGPCLQLLLAHRRMGFGGGSRMQKHAV